jgi:GAF domain-containing protein
MCQACVAAAEVDGGGVALISSEGARAVVYTSNAASTELERLQIDLAEGPCVDAGIGHAPVLIGDLEDPGEGVAERWPFFLPRAGAMGIRGLFAFPLRIGSIVLGTLELYRTTPGPLESAQLSIALQSAEDMGAAILDLRSTSELEIDGPPGATVHQAAGMVMLQLDSSIDEAMAQLRARAFTEGLTLAELSSDVIRGRRRFTKEET